MNLSLCENSLDGVKHRQTDIVLVTVACEYKRSSLVLSAKSTAAVKRRVRTDPSC